MDPAFFAGELGAAEVAADFEHAAVGEGALVGVFHVGVEKLVVARFSGAFDLDRAGAVEAERPQGDVHVMADPVEQLAAAEIHCASASSTGGASG